MCRNECNRCKMTKKDCVEIIKNKEENEEENIENKENHNTEDINQQKDELINKEEKKE